MSTLQFVDHAVERYVQRIAQGLSLHEARARLEAATATPTKFRSGSGEAYWLLPDCVAVVKHDRRFGPVCVTVVPTSDVRALRHAVVPDADPWEDAS